MSDNIFIIFLLYFLILFATIGLGQLFLLIFYKDANYLNVEYVGLLSCLILILYSYIIFLVFFSSSVVERSAVNRMVIGSSPI